MEHLNVKNNSPLKTEVLSEFLNAYWLRPETALWRALDVAAMVDFKFEGRSLDLGCGDGTFSFVRAGGRFSKTFDVFKDINNLDHYFSGVDIYDSYRSQVHDSSLVRIKPLYQISVGLDHKATLLSKSKALGLYQDLVEHDANHPLPFSNESFDRLFSNIV